MIFSFEYQGKRYEFDDTRMSLGEARWIKSEIGMIGTDFFEAVKKLDPDAMSCLVVIAMKRAGLSETTMEQIAEDENGYFDLVSTAVVRENADGEVKPVRRRTTKKVVTVAE